MSHKETKLDRMRLFQEIISKASNKELYKLKDLLDGEIRLSEQAIKEGLEEKEQ